MADPIAFPASYAMYEKDHSAGIVKAWRAPYILAGADPVGLISMGDMSNDGFEFDHKVSYSMREVQQLFYALGAYMTKQELDLKFTLQHIKPTVAYRFAMGMPNNKVTTVASTDTVRGSHTVGLGEVNDVLDSTAGPCNEPEYGQFVFQFAAPGWNFTTPLTEDATEPTCEYAYVRLYKAAVISHGSLKHTKTGEATIQVTVKAFADMSVAGVNKIGKVFIPIPKLAP